MKYNFTKLLQSGGSVRKYQNATGGDLAAINGGIVETGGGVQQFATKPTLQMTPEELAARTNTWQQTTGNQWLTNGQYDYEKMYQDYLLNKDSFDISGITATPDFTNAQRNSRGFREWNQQFQQSGLNKYFGYDEGVVDYYGPTTAARAGFLDYIKKRPPETPPPPPDTPPGIPPKQEITTEKREEEEEIPIPEPIQKLTPWTDWIPLSAQLGNDLMSAERQASLQKQMRFALKEGPFLQHKITNNYHQRTGMQQNANELRDLAAFRSNSSDLRANMDNMRKYDTQASQIENQAEQIKADTVFKERQIAENVENTNKQVGADVANYNARQNAAAWNNILDANAKRDLRRTQALNSFIGNMYTSHGEYVKDARLNEQAYQRGLNQYNAGLQQQEAYKQYANVANDFTKSQAFQQFSNAVAAPGNQIAGFDSNRYNDQTQRDAYLRELWAGNSDLAVQYRGNYETEKKEAMNRYLLRSQNIANQLEAQNLMLPARISNQGIYIPGKYGVQSNVHPVQTESYKQGGRVRARFIDYQNHIQKEQQDQRRSQHKRNELSVKKLNADLDRLSREQMILLRSVFK